MTSYRFISYYKIEAALPPRECGPDFDVPIPEPPDLSRGRDYLRFIVSAAMIKFSLNCIPQRRLRTNGHAAVTVVRYRTTECWFSSGR
jgi:hypothetical protein